MTEDLPLLDDLMPWSVPPLRLGRSWVMSPDAAALTARWKALLAAEGPERERLLRPTRARTAHTSVAQLPGQSAGTVRLAREDGSCPEPVRVLHGAFDEQWLIPDHRLIDVARPELWRVSDARQVFLVEQGYAPRGRGPALVATARLPDGRSPAGRPGRIRPLYRRPGALEPNVTPGLLELLSRRYGGEVTAADLAAWALAAARATPAGCAVPLPADPAVWRRGVELGRRMTRVLLRGAPGGERPRLPGGRRPYVRTAIEDRPDSLAYYPGEETLAVGTRGRVSPVAEAAWTFESGGARVLEQWFEARTAAAPEPGTLEAVGSASWTQARTSELLELITVLTMLALLRDEQRELGERCTAEPLSRTALAAVLAPPPAARRPASVLDHPEEGPEGQFALL
ncbi:DNA methyltransferase [Streptomyces sp. HNM0663]|uniref:DNA methyltransferase n=1 Tax=Streptomyces chengmaiensis TaxID=3040919 RepID=A0ABT6HTT5_9ACTN|nr:type ISP restriction/modification enzyme [Streptomyces chengmaiensis]MDH2391464.1 DNA methyltransferase [Streptomyces chengmaiensis]